MIKKVHRILRKEGGKIGVAILINHRMHTNQQLYRRYDPAQKHPDLYWQDFEAGSVQVRLRPFYIPEDFIIFNLWINDVINPGKDSSRPIALFTEAYFRTLLESFNAQSIWGLVNNEPAFSMDIYEAIDYHPLDLLDDLPLEAGDIILQLVINPSLDDKKARYILPACLDYLRAYPETKRVLWLADPEDQYYTEFAEVVHPALSLPVEKNKQMWIFPAKGHS